MSPLLSAAPVPCAILLRVCTAAGIVSNHIFYAMDAAFQLTSPLRFIVLNDSMETISNVPTWMTLD